MTVRRLTSTAVAVLVALGVAAAPAVGQSNARAGSITKSEGSVSATLSWKGGEFAVTQPRLKVARAGVVVTDISVADVCNGCLLVEDTFGNGPDPFSIMAVADLDADGEPEVMFDTYSGGAHCCIVQRVYGFVPAKNTYRRTLSQYWGNTSYSVKDLDQDGTPELSGADDAFAFSFSSYAASAFPPKILTYRFDATTRKAKVTDVTRRFPAIIRADAAPLLKAIRKARPQADGTHEIQGAIAAYVADQYLLGKGSVGRAEIARARRRGLTAPGFERDLLAFLKRVGYR